MIAINDKVVISQRLGKRLVELGFDPIESASMHNVWAGRIVTVLDIWTDNIDNERVEFATVDLCNEIPLDCCSLWPSG